ncbi:MAG: 16S rRNA (cytidine(1402)-2'-O)-methyltransferase [Bacteroidales bacterium]
MPKLYIIPTPIGNLEDITFRAVRILQEAHFLIAEDTRTTHHLLNHYNIKNSVVSHHKFNEHTKTDAIIQRLTNNDQVAALVSDAGMPGISDPGYLLIKKCLDEGIEIESLPGATAFLPALINSGLPSDKFVFEGFLPHKKGRTKRLKFLSEEERTMIFYESPHRLLKTLQQFSEYFGNDRRASVSRELTKIHEENARGTLHELAEQFGQKKIKGEIVVIVEGKPKK